MKKHPLLLLILDGWGYRAEHQKNAIAAANTPNWDKIWQNYPHTLISGSGSDVGLPKRQMGNSEVGHITIGAGRIFHQDLTRINMAIADQSFFANPTFKRVLASHSNTEHAVHILGLLSPGGIHSHEKHIFALIKSAATYKVKKLYLHVFLDGRDTPPQSAAASITALESLCQEVGIGEISSITGRYYAMDRDRHYERTKATYDLLTLGTAAYTASTATEALQQAYARGKTDEFVQPTKIHCQHEPGTIQNGDSVILMNFRADRARQLSYSLTCQDFCDFDRTLLPKLSEFVTLTQYADIKASVAFQNASLRNVLGECLEKQQLKQLRLAETEKYAHVTFFFNGGREQPFNGEDRILIPSPAVATYDLQPEMSVDEVSKQLVSAIVSNKYDVIICNLANADMVGHTGNMQATIHAINALDIALGNIVEALSITASEAIITADHGNAELMYDFNTNQPLTAHTNSLLPFVYIGKRNIQLQQENGTLADVAPTLLALLGLDVPKEMTGLSLLRI